MSEPTQEIPTSLNCFQIRGYHALWPSFPASSSNNIKKILGSYNPELESSVWAKAVSLVTTKAISFDFFSPATEIFQFADFPPCA